MGWLFRVFLKISCTIFPCTSRQIAFSWYLIRLISWHSNLLTSIYHSKYDLNKFAAKLFHLPSRLLKQYQAQFPAKPVHFLDQVKEYVFKNMKNFISLLVVEWTTRIGIYKHFRGCRIIKNWHLLELFLTSDLTLSDKLCNFRIISKESWCSQRWQKEKCYFKRNKINL